MKKQKIIMSECLVFSTVKSIILSKTVIQTIVLDVLSSLGVHGSVSIHCIGDKRMRSLNKRFRGKDKTTDVLSFAAQEDAMVDVYHTELGDIFISIPQIIRQSRDLGVSQKEEFIRMLVHGILHILGYDHYSKKDAKRMFSIQEKLVSRYVAL